MRKELYILVSFLAMCSAAHAQLQLPTNIQTPNASDLGKYGQVPVSNYTGTADISVPLYQTSVRGCDLNIALTYDTSGLLLNTLPSWTGHNWTLHAGGVITRCTQNFDDEYRWPRQLYESNPGLRPVRCYFQDPLTLEKCRRVAFSTYYERYLSTRDENNSPLYDNAPDIFTFNFMGKSGRFFLGNDGRWRVESDDDLEVIYDFRDSVNNLTSPFISTYPNPITYDQRQPKVISGFRIRDSRGYVYKFGYSENAIEYSTNLMRSGDREQLESWHANAWYLTSVSDKFGNELYTFSYERGKFVAQFYYSYEYSRTMLKSESGSLNIPGSYGADPRQDEFNYISDLSSPVYLTKIHTAKGCDIKFASADSELDPYTAYDKMAFVQLSSIAKRNQAHYDFEPFYYLQDKLFAQYQYKTDKDKGVYPLARCRLRKLTMVTIDQSVTHSSTPGIGYRFYYSYDNRMHLDSIQIQNGYFHFTNHAGMISSYKFYYDNMQLLPKGYCSSAIDHWGYYNGTNSTACKDAVEYYRKRNPNPETCKYGMLSRIVYPTRGSTTIEYEPNQFSSYRMFNRNMVRDTAGVAYGGGLRIKRISNYADADGRELLDSKSYDYNIPGTTKSSGCLYNLPRYLWRKWKVAGTNGSAEFWMTTFRSTSIIPLSNSFGAHIGYSYVKETSADGSSRLSRYINVSDEKDEEPVATTDTPYDGPNFTYSERNFLKGRLLSETVYSPKGEKLKSVSHQYRAGGPGQDFTYTSNLRGRTLVLPGAVIGRGDQSLLYVGYASESIYKLFYGRTLPQSTADTVYYDGRTVAQKNEYSYKCMEIYNNEFYNHIFSVNLLASTGTTSSDGLHKRLTKYEYYSDRESNPALDCLYHRMGDYQPLSISYYDNGRLMKKDTTYFSFINNAKQYAGPVKCVERYPDGDSVELVSKIEYTKSGAISRYHRLGEPDTNIFWGYNDNYIIAWYEGYLPYRPNVPSGADIFSEDKMLPFMESLREAPLPHNVTGYVGHPLFGVADIISNNGGRTSFKYDDFCRLKSIYDCNGILIRQYGYNYKK